MKHSRFVFVMLVLATCGAAGCASVEREGMSFKDGKEIAAVQSERICSDVAPVGSHMKRVVCRSREVIDHTSERAQKALRDRAVRKQLPREGGGR